LCAQRGDVRDDAIKVAERMGLMPQIRSMATDVQGMLFVNARGEPVATIDLQTIQQRNGSGEAEILRGDLVQLLYAAIPNDVEFLFGNSIVSLQQTERTVTVTFDQGILREFDLVVGADGIHSQVRRLVFGPEAEFVRYLGYYEIGT